MAGRPYPSNPSNRHDGGGGGRGNPKTSGGSGGGGASADGPQHQPAGAAVSASGDGGATPALSPESLSLARLRQKSISHPLQQCQLAIYVPPRTVGAVIGRGGRTILSVQREAMRRSAGHVAPVRISVLGGGGSAGNAAGGGQEGFPSGQQGGAPAAWNYADYQQQQQKPDSSTTTAPNQTKDDDNGGEWTPVIIRGDPVGCFSAARQLLPLVDYDHDRDIVFEVPVHRAKHNMLVGKGGTVIAALSATHAVRIMIPPNEFMSNVSGMGGDNFWKTRQAHQERAQQNAGARMLFGGGDVGGGGGGGAGNGAMQPNPNSGAQNVIQLEGEIDKVEKCLTRMLGIVAGERWVPTGTIVEAPEAPETGKGDGKDGGGGGVKSGGGGKKGAPKVVADANAHANADVPPSAQQDVPSGKDDKSGKGKKEDMATTAEAVIVKVWTPSSKLLNLGRIRKVQRRTNTVIRRKKLRISSEAAADLALQNIKEEEEDKEEDTAEPSADGDDDEDEGDVAPKEDSATGPRTATKYIITGKTESVRSATAQFEKILGLEPGSATVTDTTNKTASQNPSAAKDGGGGNAVGGKGADAKAQGGTNKPEGDTDAAGGGGGQGGKKMRRKKKRGPGKGGGGGQAPKGSKEGQSQNPAG